MELANRGNFHSGELLRCRRIFLFSRGAVSAPNNCEDLGRGNSAPTSKMRLAFRVSSALNNRSRILTKYSGSFEFVEKQFF